MSDQTSRDTDDLQNAETRKEIVKLSRRFVMIFVIPLIVIVVLGLYTIYLSWRVVKLETYAEMFAVLEDTNIIERYYTRDRNSAWATEQYEKITRRRPDPRFLTRLGGLYVAKGDYEKAIAKLNEAIKLDPTYWEAHSILMYLYAKQGREKDAMQEGETAVDLNKLDATALNNLAWLYATANDGTLQDLKKAMEYANRAIDYTGSRNVEILDTLAEIQFRMGDAGSAVTTIERGIKSERSKLDSLEAQRQRFVEAEKKRQVK